MSTPPPVPSRDTEAPLPPSRAVPSPPSRVPPLSQRSGEESTEADDLLSFPEPNAVGSDWSPVPPKRSPPPQPSADVPTRIAPPPPADSTADPKTLLQTIHNGSSKGVTAPRQSLEVITKVQDLIDSRTSWRLSFVGPLDVNNEISYYDETEDDEVEEDNDEDYVDDEDDVGYVWEDEDEEEEDQVLSVQDDNVEMETERADLSGEAGVHRNEPDQMKQTQECITPLEHGSLPEKTLVDEEPLQLLKQAPAYQEADTLQSTADERQTFSLSSDSKMKGESATCVQTAETSVEVPGNEEAITEIKSEAHETSSPSPSFSFEFAPSRPRDKGKTINLGNQRATFYASSSNKSNSDHPASPVSPRSEPLNQSLDERLELLYQLRQTEAKYVEDLGLVARVSLSS